MEGVMTWDEQQTLLWLNQLRCIMHNLMSRNQLDEWRHFENTIDELESEDRKVNLLNDYYECLIECDNTAQCKKICREILM